jgi:monoamine oxidase
MHSSNIVILGGGLSGLTIAYLLKQEGISSTILEARNRLGGRIHTLSTKDGGPVEMGATWLGKKHSHLVKLLEELDIDIIEQFMGNKGYYEPISVSPPQLVDLPANEEPSYRIEGGTDAIIHTLENHLDQKQIKVNHQVTSIRKDNTSLTINTSDGRFEADFVINTLPPKLLMDTISITPSLPDQFCEIARNTHTWMAESIKVALTFERPFWRNNHSSGTIFSNVGPVTEMYDHSQPTLSFYALKGFMNESYHTVSEKERKTLVLEQLRRFYGDKIDTCKQYHETVWKDEPFSYADYENNIIPHQHNGHPTFQESYLDDRLLISGSETATHYPGYMDGAVESARRSVQQLKKQLS